MTELIKSISYSQHEILLWILKLIDKEKFYLDPTFGKGNFYKKGVPLPSVYSDLYPIRDDIFGWDSRSLPLMDNSVDSIIFDPPFLTTKPKSHDKNTWNKGSNIIIDSFGYYKNQRELNSYYKASLDEFYRVLLSEGYVVFKCQDQVSGGKQYLTHCYIHEMAMLSGFYVKDFFVLLAKNRIISPKHKNQQHARKFHCYFFLLQKKNVNLKL